MREKWCQWADPLFFLLFNKGKEKKEDDGVYIVFCSFSNLKHLNSEAPVMFKVINPLFHVNYSIVGDHALFSNLFVFASYVRLFVELLL